MSVIAAVVLAVFACGLSPACGTRYPGGVSGKSSMGAGGGTTADPLELLAKDSFVVEVTADGRIFLGEIEVTEDELRNEALIRLMEDTHIKAILLVGSSQIQGIHLTALLAEVGFSNVTVYYPTATVPR